MAGDSQDGILDLVLSGQVKLWDLPAMPHGNTKGLQEGSESTLQPASGMPPETRGAFRGLPPLAGDARRSTDYPIPCGFINEKPGGKKEKGDLDEATQIKQSGAVK
jgi:hypothetical protein